MENTDGLEDLVKKINDGIVDEKVFEWKAKDEDNVLYI